MTDENTPSNPAGWYAEPSGGEHLRWWDGQKWTDDTAPGRSTVAEGTSVYNPWVWLIVVIPLLAVLPLFFWDVPAYLQESLDSSRANPFPLFGQPAYVATLVASFLAYAFVIVLAYVDWMWLGARGYLRRFHWVFAFLGPLVYLIGRAVIVKKATGHGTAPAWIYGALSIALAAALSIWLLIVTFEFVAQVS